MPSSSCQPVDHLARVVFAARRPECGSALVVDVRHERGVQDGRFSARWAEAAVAIAEADDVLDAVALGELEHKSPDHVVDAWAQAAARDDAAPQAPRVEEDVIARARQLEGWRARRLVAMGRHDTGKAVVQEDTVGLANVVDGGAREAVRERGRMTAAAEDFHLDVRTDDALGSLRDGQTQRHGSHTIAGRFRLTFFTVAGCRRGFSQKSS
jgi:hypothetical protein